MLLAVLLHILYGCTFTISKILVGFASPIFVIGIRMIIAGFLLSSYAYFFIKHREQLDKRSWWYIGQIAVFGVYFPYVLRYWALKFLPVTKTALLYSISPFASFFFSYLFFREKATWKKWLGLFFGLSGALPILFTQSSGEVGLQSFSILSWPEIAMLFSVCCFSYGWVVMKKLVLYNRTIPPARINGLNMLIGGCLAMLTSLSIESSHVISQPGSFFLWLGLIIVMTNFICFNLYAVLLRTYSATLLSLIGLLAPVSAALTSWWYFGEVLTVSALFSGLLVFAGCLLFYLEEVRLANAAAKADDEISLS